MATPSTSDFGFVPDGASPSPTPLPGQTPGVPVSSANFGFVADDPHGIGFVPDGAGSPTPTPLDSPSPLTDVAAGETGFTGFLKGADLPSVPRDVGLALAGPLPGAYHALHQAYDVARGMPVAQAIPESQKFVGIEQKPLRERLKVGLETALDLVFAKQLGEQATGGIQDASTIGSTTEIPVRDQGVGVGTQTSFREQGETAGAQEPVPAGEPVAPTTPEANAPGVSYGIPEGLIEEGLHTEHPDVAAKIDRYVMDNDASGIFDALKDPGYDAYQADLHRLLRHFYGDEIPVARVSGYASGGVGKSGGLAYVSVSTNPKWGLASEKRGLPVWRGTVKPEDVILAGHEGEGELIVKKAGIKTQETAEEKAQGEAAAAAQPDISGTGKAGQTITQAQPDAPGVKEWRWKVGGGGEYVSPETPQKGYLPPPPTAQPDAPGAPVEPPPTGEAPVTPEGEPNITSIKNEIVDRERARRGLPSVIEPARKAFGDAWEAAGKMIERDPRYQDDLINELRSKPRALTDVEDAALLHRQVELQNLYDKSAEDLIKANEAGDEDAMDENRLHVAQLGDELLDLYNVGKASGTETGRGLAARKLLAAEDFSLANMITKKRAAKGGRPLTPEEDAEVRVAHKNITARQIALDAYETSPRAEAYRKQLRKLAQSYRDRVARGDYSPLPKKALVPDREHVALRAEVEKAKQDFWQGMMKDRMSQRTVPEKIQDTLSKWRRGFILSSPVVLAKLTSAAFQRMAFTPMEEAIGAGLRKVPGISKVAERARYGSPSISAEAAAITQGFTAGMHDSWQVLQTGRSDLDLLYGKKNVLPAEAIDFFGHLHGALKTVTKRNEFARRYQQLAEEAIKSGTDVTDPLVQTRLGTLAYKEANRSIFLQDNRVVEAWKRGIGALERPSKITGTTRPGAKTLATTMKVMVPIVRVPTNIVAETMQYATGSVTGSVRLANAFRKGIENLPAEQADLIMRDLKKGSLGAAVMTLGFLNPNMFGGYYQRGVRRDPRDVKVGEVRIGGVNVPPYLVHNPLLETAQLGATIRRVAESKLRKKDTGPQGIPMGVLAGGLGLTEEVPFVRETTGDLPKLFSPRERGQYLGELARSLVVPQAVQWAASQMDKQSGEPVKRKADTIMEGIEMGIPGLRQNVPQRSVGAPGPR